MRVDPSEFIPSKEEPRSPATTCRAITFTQWCPFLPLQPKRPFLRKATCSRRRRSVQRLRRPSSDTPRVVRITSTTTRIHPRARLQPRYGQTRTQHHPFKRNSLLCLTSCRRKQTNLLRLSTRKTRRPPSRRIIRKMPSNKAPNNILTSPPS